MTWLIIRDKVWKVSIVRGKELTQGLGHHPGLAHRNGMLFDLGKEKPIDITTQDMLFPIDVAFISGNMKVVATEIGVTPGWNLFISWPVRYFLEVNSGDLIEIRTGDRIKIGGD